MGKIIARAQGSCRRSNKLGIKIITIGVGTEKEAQSFKKNGVVEGFKRTTIMKW
jgi:hypothetical protein